MKDRLIPLAPYAALLAADFYLLPPLARDTGAAMLLMLCVMPLAAFITALACGMRRGFSPLLPAAAFALFLPTIPIYYNSSAWVYAVAYAVIVLAGKGHEDYQEIRGVRYPFLDRSVVREAAARLGL